MTPSRLRFHAIIPSAGSGTRFGGMVKKQFLHIGEVSLLDRTLDTFLKSALFERIVVCVPAEELEAPTPVRYPASVTFIEGGGSRFESVRKGFEFLNPDDQDFVLIHDAVRPLVSVDLIYRIARALPEKRALIPVVPLTDTIKEMEAGQVLKTLDRSRLYAAQTPQGFSCALIRKMYKTQNSSRGPQITDEAMGVEALGETVFTVEGEKSNIKVTTPLDLKIAEVLINGK